MTFCIYLITNKLNHKVYVGKTKDFLKRWAAHKTVAKTGNKNKSRIYPIHAAINKYGEDNFEAESLLVFDTESEAFGAEVAYITQLKLYGFKLYNITDGGEGSSGAKSKFSPKEKEEICAKYIAGAAQQALAREYKCANLTIQRIIVANNIPIRTVSQQNKGKLPKNINILLEKKTPKSESEKIISLHNSGMGTRKLAKLFNRNRSTIMEVIKRIS